MSPKENEHKRWKSILPRHISQRKILLFPADYFKPQECGVFQKRTVTILKTSYNTVENKVNCDWALGDLTVTGMSALLFSMKD